jgi:hypothetical protein
MNEFTIVTLIGRPVDQVFPALTDLSKAPMWTPGLTEAHQTSDGPMGTGSTVVHAGTFLGRNYETHAVCTDWTENKRYATKSTSGPFYIELDTTLEPVTTGTRMTSVFRGEKPRLLQACRTARSQADQKAFRDRCGKPANAARRRRIVSGQAEPFGRSGARALGRVGTPYSHPGSSCQRSAKATEMLVAAIRSMPSFVATHSASEERCMPTTSSFRHVSKTPSSAHSVIGW